MGERPDPEEVLAEQRVDVFVNDYGMVPRVLGSENALHLIAALAAAGLRVVPVPGEQPAPSECPNCKSDDPRKVGIRPATPLTGTGAYSMAFSEVCADPWHGAAPSPDEDTRRERLSAAVADGQEMVKAIRVVEQREPLRFAKVPTVEYVELVEAAAAYLGGTDGR